MAALVVSVVPIVNVIAIVAGLAAVGLGVTVIALARRGLQGGRRRAVAGVVMGALGIVVAVVVDIVAGFALLRGDDVQDLSVPPARPSASATASAGPSSSATTGASPEAPTPAPPVDGALALGQSAPVGDYTVTVTAVQQDAGATIAEANQFNQPAAGQYVLVDVSVVYQGAEEGTPWAQLQAEYLGTDARNYSWTSCTATVPRPGFQQPNLRSGGTADYQVCFDVPPAAVAGGQVRFSPLLLGGDEAVWSAG